MILGLKMITSLSVLLCAVIIQDAYGTFFPPVEDGPPIPSVAVRGQPPQTFSPPQDLPQNLPQPKEEGFFLPDRKQDEERWYYGESQPTEVRESQTSIETFDRYYQSGEPAIGPVATPIPDDTYLAQSSSISRLNPADIRNAAANSEIFILTRDTEGQYNPERWVEVQIPSERLIEVVNQDPGVQVATDTVKSIAPPVSFNISPKTQLSRNPPVNIVRYRPRNSVELQKVYSNSPIIVENLPSPKQVVSAPPLPSPNVKNIVQQQIISDISPVALPLPAPPQISSKKSFSVPPPPPPPFKGVDAPPPKVISSFPINVIPDSNVVLSNKNIIPDSNIVPGKNVLQQVRHVWIPTSSKTGKFITIPISGSINSRKSSTVNKGFSLESTPVTVSDTWVLKQDGPVPVFQQQKSPLPPALSPVVQSGKVIFQNPTIVQVGEPGTPVFSTLESPKNLPVVDKTIASNVPRDIWPIRKEIEKSEKVLNNYPPVIASDVAVGTIKSDAVVLGKSVAAPLLSPQKTIVLDTKSALPSPIPTPNLQIVNGKPCPLPPPLPQKSAFAPLNSGITNLPRFIPSQSNLPFARIIRVNRFPSGGYYLLNRNIRPSYFVYPSQNVLQQPNSGLISVVQTKDLPTQFQRNIPLPPFQTKQISIPVQSKQIASPLFRKQAAYPFPSRQVILPSASPKSARIIYPNVQTIRYAYPWNAYLKSSPILGKGLYGPEFGSFKISSAGSKSESSSSESSSSEESSKEKKEEKAKKKKKEEKAKKEKSKKEEKEEAPASDEGSSSNESKKETESESSSKSEEKESEEKSSPEESSVEKSSEENSSEKETEESSETSE